MQLQNILIPDNDRGCPEMYIRGGTMSNGCISLSKGESLTLDTYFNSFSYTKYREFTNVSEISFTLQHSGSLSVRLMVYNGKENFCVGQGKGTSVKLQELPENGFLYAEITAEEDCLITGGGYHSPAEAHDISVCIAICTFRREQFILRNLELLRSYPFSFIKHVFVSDNGNTLDNKALSDDRISVLPNKNYGGSGGFTRGMIEACDAGYSHVILMDDDVELYPEVLERMTVFMSLVKKEYSGCRFSAAMLFLSDKMPYLQWEMGGRWTGHCIESCCHNMDVRSRDVLIQNLSGEHPNYGAWWCLCLPTDSIRKHGLSLPMFIKLDDVEHNLRTAEGPLITMNGAAIFHESFEKKMNMALDYYTIRNELVTAALHGSSTKDAVKLFVYSIGKHLLFYRYDNIPLILKAARDFLGGVDFFLACDEEQLNNEIRRSSPKLVKLSDIPEYNRELLNGAPNSVRKGGKLKGMLWNLAPSFLLKKDISAVALPFASPEDFTGRRAVIQYQLDEDMGILTRRRFGSFLKYGFLGAFMALRLALSFGGQKKRWQKRHAELTSFEFWRKHLDI